MELKSSGEIGSIEDATPEGREAIDLIESRLAELGVLDICVHLRTARKTLVDLKTTDATNSCTRSKPTGCCR